MLLLLNYVFGGGKSSLIGTEKAMTDSQPTQQPIDEEKLLDEIVNLLAEYRRIDEVVFDIPKSTKNEQLTDIRRQLSQHVSTATTLYEATIPKLRDGDEDLVCDTPPSILPNINPRISRVFLKTHSPRLTRETSLSKKSNEDFEPSVSFNECFDDGLVESKDAETEEGLPTSIFTAALMNYLRGVFPQSVGNVGRFTICSRGDVFSETHVAQLAQVAKNKRF